MERRAGERRGGVRRGGGERSRRGEMKGGARGPTFTPGVSSSSSCSTLSSRMSSSSGAILTAAREPSAAPRMEGRGRRRRGSYNLFGHPPS